MKIICTTERKIEENTSCRKEYCCKGLEKAMNKVSTGESEYAYASSDFSITKDNKIQIQTHSEYEEATQYATINFCPWCGVKLVVEHEKVDNTGLPPKLPEQPPLKTVPKARWKWW